VFTVQEEVGLRGARTAAFDINPDVVIAVDVTPTAEATKAGKSPIALGKGAAIKMQDTGLIVPMAVREWMIDRAERDAVPYQREVLTLGTTDAAALQLHGSGVPSGAVSIPARYVHTSSETIHLGDVEACIKLLTALTHHAVDL